MQEYSVIFIQIYYICIIIVIYTRDNNTSVVIVVHYCNSIHEFYYQGINCKHM